MPYFSLSLSRGVGTINEAQRDDIVRSACPGAGACGGMYTANTSTALLRVFFFHFPIILVAVAIEALGMSLPFSSSTPAMHPLKLQGGSTDVPCRICTSQLICRVP